MTVRTSKLFVSSGRSPFGAVLAGYAPSLANCRESRPCGRRPLNAKPSIFQTSRPSVFPMPVNDVACGAAAVRLQARRRFGSRAFEGPCLNPTAYGLRTDFGSSEAGSAPRFRIQKAFPYALEETAPLSSQIVSLKSDSRMLSGRYRTMKLSGRSGRLCPEPRKLPRVSALRVPGTNVKPLSLTSPQAAKVTRELVSEAPLSPVKELKRFSSTGSTVSDFRESLSFAYGNQDRGLMEDSYPVRVNRMLPLLIIDPVLCFEGESFPLQNPSSAVPSISKKQHPGTEKAREKSALLTVNHMSNGLGKGGFTAFTVRLTHPTQPCGLHWGVTA